VRTLTILWTVAALASAARGFLQFYHRYRDAVALHAQTYGFYLDDRMTGFTSLWMTFGGIEMIVVLMLLSLLMFSAARQRWVGWIAAAVLLVSIVMGLTRSIFLLGVPAGLLYLLWNRRPWMATLLPAAAVLGFVVAPPAIRERVKSVVRPHEGVDSNEHRYITRRVGWEMIRAHPIFGLGPEQVGRQFLQYVPDDLPKPLPRGWYGHLHNIYLQYAAERGVPATIFMLWWMAVMIRDFRRALQNPALSDDARFVLHGAIAVIIAVLAEGLLEHNLGDSEVLTLFLSVVAAAYVTVQEASSYSLTGAADTRVFNMSN
jgi:O-antigen ligase